MIGLGKPAAEPIDVLALFRLAGSRPGDNAWAIEAEAGDHRAERLAEAEQKAKDLIQEAGALAARLDEICREVSNAIAGGARVIVLSDRHSTAELAPIPSLLLTAAVHHHLIREKTRTQVGLVVECGDAREVHHMALLIGYGAGAVIGIGARADNRRVADTTVLFVEHTTCRGSCRKMSMTVQGYSAYGTELTVRVF